MPNRIIRSAEVEALTGLKRNIRYKLEANNQFPRAIRISERLQGYSLKEVQAWIDQKVEDDSLRIETIIDDAGNARRIC